MKNNKYDFKKDSSVEDYLTERHEDEICQISLYEDHLLV